MSHVISLITGKGGAGKSTLAFNLSGAIAEKHNKVILVDADNEKPDAYGMYKQAEDNKPKFDIILADHDNLRDQVRDLKTSYDYIIFDTPPNYTVSSLRSCMVSDLAIIVASPSFSDENAVPKSINIAKDAAKPSYVLLNKIVNQQKLSQNLLNEMDNSSYKVFNTHITDKVAIRECAYFGEYVGTYATNSKSHIEFKNLSQEIIKLF
jgi:chromosome partitioning protein